MTRKSRRNRKRSLAALKGWRTRRRNMKKRRSKRSYRIRRRSSYKGRVRRKATSEEWVKGIGGVSQKARKPPRKGFVYTGKGSRAKNQQAIAEVKRIAKDVISRQPRYDFGFGFLWGYVAGKMVLISSIDGRENHSLIQREVEKHPAVDFTWVNMD